MGFTKPEFQTVIAKLNHWATTYPDTPAFIFVDSSFRSCVLTQADLFRLSSRYAAVLRHHGVQEGQVVVNTLPNSPHRLLTDLGILLAGVVAMNDQLFLADGKDFLGSLKVATAWAIILDTRQPKGAASVLEHREHIRNGAQLFTICRQAFSIMRGPYLVCPGWLDHRISHCAGVQDVMVVPGQTLSSTRNCVPVSCLFQGHRSRQKA